MKTKRILLLLACIFMLPNLGPQLLAQGVRFAGVEKGEESKEDSDEEEFGIKQLHRREERKRKKIEKQLEEKPTEPAIPSDWEKVRPDVKEKLGIENEEEWKAIQPGWERLTPERQRAILRSEDTSKGRRQSVMIEKSQWFNPSKMSALGENLELLQVGLRAAPDVISEYAEGVQKTVAAGPKRFLEGGAGIVPFTGVVERKLLRSPLPVVDKTVLEVVAVWSVTDQQPLVELAKAFSQTYVPKTEVIVNLSNMNLENFEDVFEKIEKEKFYLRQLLGSLGGMPTDATLSELLKEQEDILISDLSQQARERKLDIIKLQIKLAGLNNDNITYLLLGRNHLTEVPNAVFKRLPNLKVLDLGSNAIEYVGDYAFAGLKKLFCLNISDNPKLEELPVSSLHDAKNSLRWLSITQTRLARRINITEDDPALKAAQKVLPRRKKFIKKLNLRSKFLFTDERKNYEALEKAFPKAHIRTTALFSRTLIITTIKKLGIVALAALLYTQAGLIAFLFGINLEGAVGMAAVTKLLKKLTIMFGTYAGYQVISARGLLKPKPARPGSGGF